MPERFSIPEAKDVPSLQAVENGAGMQAPLPDDKPLTQYSSWWFGPVLAMIVAVIVELFRLYAIHVPNPGSIFFLLVVYASISGGMRSGLPSATLSLLYMMYYNSIPGTLFQFEGDVKVRMWFLGFNVHTIAIMVGLLQQRAKAQQDKAIRDAVTSQSREWLVTTLHSIGDAVIAVDTRKNITFMNPIAEALTGYSEAEARGKALVEVFNIINEGTRQTVLSPVDEVLRTGEIVGLANHTILIARDGTERHIDDSAAPIKNSRGETWGVVLVFHDITQRKSDEATLRKSERLFRTTIEQSPLAVIIMDPQGQVLQVNDSWEELYGAKKADIVGVYNMLEDPQLKAIGVMPMLERIFAGESAKLPLIEYDPRKSGKVGRVRWIQPFGYAVKDDELGVTEVVVKIEDVTDRQQAIQALSQSEERYHSLVSATSQIVWTANPDGMVEDMAMWRAFTGQTRETVRGWGWLNAIHPDDRDRTSQSWGRAIANRTTYQTEYRVRRHDGTYRIFSVRGVPVLNDDGGIREWVGACTDITEQKQAEAQVIGQTRILELVATGNPLSETLDAVADLVERQSEAWCAILELSEPERLQDLSVLAAPSLPTAAWNMLENGSMEGILVAALRNNVLTMSEEGEIDPHSAALNELVDTRVFQSCWAQPITTAGGDRIGVITMFSGQKRPSLDERRLLEMAADLAGIAIERSHAERNLTDALDRQARTAANLSSIVDHIADAVIAVNSDGEFLFINDNAHKMFGVAQTGCSLQEFTQRYRLIAQDGIPALYTDHPLVRALSGETVQGEWQIERDRNCIWVQGNSTPVTDDAGNSLGALLTLHDVTAQREAVRELVRANQMKDEFLAIVSHELRTPLTPILGWTSLLRQSISKATSSPIDPAFIDQAAESIQRNAELQKRLVNDLLDTSRIMSGKLRIEPQLTDLNDLVTTAAASAQQIGADRKIVIDAQIDERIPQLVFDTERIQQVLMNILTNAIKFSPAEGTIRIGTRLDKEGSHAIVEITDGGEGIAPDLLPYVFEAFRQGDSSYTRRHGGMGLGLAISKSLIEMHGGSLSARSEGLGQGATFIITLPVPQEQSAVSDQLSAVGSQ